MAWCEGRVFSGRCWQPVLSPNGTRLCFYHLKISLGQIRPSDGSLFPPGWRPADRPEFQEVTEDGWLRLGVGDPLVQLLTIDAREPRRELSAGDNLSFLR